MAGHGHVTLNLDGSKARCGGPAICAVCAREAGEVLPLRPELVSTHAEQRRNALWFHATTKGLFDPAIVRIRPYTVDELATLWAVTPEVVRQGVAEAEKINAKLTEAR